MLGRLLMIVGMLFNVEVTGERMECKVYENMRLCQKMIVCEDCPDLSESTLTDWLSVDDALPEGNDHCLVFANHEIYLGWYDIAEESFYMVRYGRDDNIKLGRATHWMNLPKPPQK